VGIALMISVRLPTRPSCRHWPTAMTAFGGCSSLFCCRSIICYLSNLLPSCWFIWCLLVFCLSYKYISIYRFLATARGFFVSSITPLAASIDAAIHHGFGIKQTGPCRRLCGPCYFDRPLRCLWRHSLRVGAALSKGIRPQKPVANGLHSYDTGTIGGICTFISIVKEPPS